MPVERIVGIDFGTSTSLVKVKAYRDGKPVDGDPTLAHYVEFDGRNMVPTLIRFAGADEYYGYDANQTIPGSSMYRNFKLDLQSQDRASRAQAEELTRKFVRFLYERYAGQSEHFGQFDTQRTLVSYPAKWTRETRDFMVKAAAKAGFKNVSGMDEPTAALYTVMAQESGRLVEQKYLTPGKPAYVLMIDMGAGTTDLALCRYTPGGENKIIDTWPPANSKVLFGGREMDELLIQYLLNYLKRCGVGERQLKNFEKQNMENCKGWKESSVSLALKNNRSVNGCGFVSQLFMMSDVEELPFPAINRAVLEKFCRDYISRYAGLIAEAMAHARQVEPNFNAGDLSLAVLTGGHSQWYFAKDMLCCSLPGYEGGVGVRLSENQVVGLTQPQGTVSSGLVFSPQFEKGNMFAEGFWTSQRGQTVSNRREGKSGGTPSWDGAGKSETRQQQRPNQGERSGQAMNREARQETSRRVEQEANREAEQVARRTAGQETNREVRSAPKQGPSVDLGAAPARQNGSDANLNEKISRYVYMTARSRADAAAALNAAGGDLKAALDEVYGAIMDAPDEAYADWLAGCFRSASRVDAEKRKVLEQAAPLLPGEVPYIYFDNTMLGQGRDLQFLTSQRWLHIEKKLVRSFVVTEKLEFSKVSSFFRYGAWLMFIKKPLGFKGFVAASLKETYNTYRIYLGLYLRWRKHNGLDPYNMKMTDAPKGFKPEGQ